MKTTITTEMVNAIYNKLYKVNPVVFGMRKYRTQVQACKDLLSVYSEEELHKVLDWYIAELQRTPRDKFLPVATIPTKLLEKWYSIYEMYKEKQGSRIFTKDDISRQYNPF